ncbi:MAG: hypothetical protein DF280_01890 ['Brassica napus' phytoplasma]|nr:MAG: hypothetical protein DF280_01890 ['Brassica napus' phytoplasma]
MKALLQHRIISKMNQIINFLKKKEVLDKFDPKQYEIFKEKIIDFILSPDITEDEIKYALNQLVDECVNHNEEIIDKLSETFFDWE